MPVHERIRIAADIVNGELVRFGDEPFVCEGVSIDALAQLHALTPCCGLARLTGGPYRPCGPHGPRSIAHYVARSLEVEGEIMRTFILIVGLTLLANSATEAHAAPRGGGSSFAGRADRHHPWLYVSSDRN